MTQGFKKIAPILANVNCTTTPSKVKSIIDRLKQRVGIIKGILNKVKDMLRSIHSNIKRVLQVLASMNTTSSLDFLNDGVDGEIS